MLNKPRFLYFLQKLASHELLLDAGLESVSENEVRLIIYFRESRSFGKFIKRNF